MRDGWYMTSGATTFGNITTTATTGVVFTNGPVTLAATPPKKRTPLEWLEDEVERVCALTRPGLAT